MLKLNLKEVELPVGANQIGFDGGSTGQFGKDHSDWSSQVTEKFVFATVTRQTRPRRPGYYTAGL